VQSRFFVEITHFGISSLWYEPYGLVGVELDAEALRNGTVDVVHARGIFPDGLPFNMPESDPLPVARSIADVFPPTREILTVLLAVPPYRSGTSNCTLAVPDANSPTRFIADTVMIPDENTGTDEKALKVGRKWIYLLLDTEDAGDMQTLPIARIRRDGSGKFVYDETFIPPCTQISASPTLMLMTRRLIEMLQEKSMTMSLGSRTSGKFQSGFSAQEVGQFWFLHAINSSLGPLRNLFYTKRGHPEELFVELLRLGGALCTFALDSHPRNLPLYNHLGLDACFGALERHILEHLDLLAPSNVISIPLTKTADYFYEGDVKDQRCLDRARWMFSVHSPLGDADVITRTLQLVKICSAQFVPQLVKRALPGLEMTHVPVPPSAIARKVESHYFSVGRAGPCWDHIVQTRRVGVYIPGEIPTPEIELLVILES
jgi:type VI secretion system protein ImpJ